MTSKYYLLYISITLISLIVSCTFAQSNFKVNDDNTMLDGSLFKLSFTSDQANSNLDLPCSYTLNTDNTRIYSKFVSTQYNAESTSTTDVVYQYLPNTISSHSRDRYTQSSFINKNHKVQCWRNDVTDVSVGFLTIDLDVSRQNTGLCTMRFNRDINYTTTDKITCYLQHKSGSNVSEYTFGEGNKAVKVTVLPNTNVKAKIGKIVASHHTGFTAIPFTVNGLASYSSYALDVVTTQIKRGNSVPPADIQLNKYEETTTYSFLAHGKSANTAANYHTTDNITFYCGNSKNARIFLDPQTHTYSIMTDDMSSASPNMDCTLFIPSTDLYQYYKAQHPATAQWASSATELRNMSIDYFSSHTQIYIGATTHKLTYPTVFPYSLNFDDHVPAVLCSIATTTLTCRPNVVWYSLKNIDTPEGFYIEDIPNDDENGYRKPIKASEFLRSLSITIGKRSGDRLEFGGSGSQRRLIAGISSTMTSLLRINQYGFMISYVHNNNSVPQKYNILQSKLDYDKYEEKTTINETDNIQTITLKLQNKDTIWVQDSISTIYLSPVTADTPFIVPRNPVLTIDEIHRDQVPWLKRTKNLTCTVALGEKPDNKVILQQVDHEDFPFLYTGKIQNLFTEQRSTVILECKIEFNGPYIRAREPHLGNIRMYYRINHDVGTWIIGNPTLASPVTKYGYQWMFKPVVFAEPSAPRKTPTEMLAVMKDMLKDESQPQCRDQVNNLNPEDLILIHVSTTNTDYLVDSTIGKTPTGPINTGFAFPGYTISSTAAVTQRYYYILNASIEFFVISTCKTKWITSTKPWEIENTIETEYTTDVFDTRPVGKSCTQHNQCLGDYGFCISGICSPLDLLSAAAPRDDFSYTLYAQSYSPSIPSSPGNTDDDNSEDGTDGGNDGGGNDGGDDDTDGNGNGGNDDDDTEGGQTGGNDSFAFNVSSAIAISTIIGLLFF